jgi:hypothetical protein
MRRAGLFALLVFLLLGATHSSGEPFPIATAPGSEMGLSAAFGGTNYLVGITGGPDPRTQKDLINAQLVSQTGELVGNRIFVENGRGGLPVVGFDGANYLLTWQGSGRIGSAKIFGQFIKTDGSLAGPSFVIGEAWAIQDMGIGSLAFDGTTYLIVWSDLSRPRGRSISGQLVSKTGELVGPKIRISGTQRHAQNPNVAFDGTRYLTVWLNDGKVYGQFLSTEGTLSGTSFDVDSKAFQGFPASGPNTFLIFDGTRYVLSTQGRGGFYARFIDKGGVVSPRKRLCEWDGTEGCYVSGFDGNYYLVSRSGGFPMKAKARFHNGDLIPVGDWITLFEAERYRALVGTAMAFDGTRFLAIGTIARFNPYHWGDLFLKGDVYGNFVQLVEAEPVLTVTKTGTGNGRVGSQPEGIDCGTICSKRFGKDKQVQLFAEPNGDSGFIGWSGGGCSGEQECVVPMTENVTITAVFGSPPNISLDPRSWDFENVPVNQSKSATFKISNTGSQDLMIGSICPSYSSEITLESDMCSNVTVEPGGFCTFLAVFSPSYPGEQLNTFAIPSNDPQNRTVGVSLSGIGVL